MQQPPKSQTVPPRWLHCPRKGQLIASELSSCAASYRVATHHYKTWKSRNLKEVKGKLGQNVFLPVLLLCVLTDASYATVSAGVSKHRLSPYIAYYHTD